MNLVTIACPAEHSLRSYELCEGELRQVALTDMAADVSVVTPALPQACWVRLKSPHRVALLERRGDGWETVAEAAAPDSLNFLAATEDRHWLLGVSYAGGQVCAWPLDPQGVPGECVVIGQGQHPHSVVIAGDVAHVAFLGEDMIVSYRREEDAWAEVARHAAPTGSGPRHLLLSADAAQLWCLTEFSGEVLHWHRDREGGLTFAGAASAVDPAAGLSPSRLGADPVAEHLVWGADLHQCGEVLIASERTSSRLAVLPLGADGLVLPATSFVDAPAQPRGFAVVDNLVVCVGERDDEAVVYRLVDKQLTEVSRAGCGKGANWVAIW